MAKYKAYSEYRDSGVEWLGNVPTKWLITELKRYSWVKGGYAFASDLFISFGEPVIRIGDISQDGSINLANCKYVSRTIAKQSQSYIVQNGELLMAMTGATIGKAGFYENKSPALINQRVGLFKTLDKLMNYRFLWYTLKSSGYQEYIKLTAFGGAQPNISDAGMVGYRTTIPSLQEQVFIASFLDNETAKIDSLIEKQQQIIELLKEKRQAVISHAVTKGLNPDVPMKDSGVEWLGTIPKHWSIWKLFHAYDTIGSGTTPTSNDENWFQGNIPWVTTGELRENIINNTLKNISTVTLQSFSALKLYPAGSIIIAMYGATIGRIGILGVDATTNQACCAMTKSKVINNLYLKYWLQTFRENIINLSSGGGQPNINQEKVASLKISSPDLNEQLIIIDFLDKKTTKIDDLISKQLQQIELLKERRTALISAAVTGKIDVRHWRAPNEQATTEAEVAV
ncbi:MULTISPECIES: restriction endonuclease subunit S [Citrobacter]|uniref:restriction endonuclease subunit S n=1 Tax=Citrobacter TaxID=544 RepID=UPI001F3C05AC|nr:MULTISPECIES: restriction endonuclease subunit S [Citrobacter]MBJ9323245.1 restriction endonuclease subunit S [Citrobacter freundii]MBK2670600.1 restriction endonuclease subunit S [Citrobacter freundii]MCQ9455732.1 restriction endonuclease subunit S [Citrobacter portucalensis]MDM2836295.1 restriction endonuclease subunit S [Citrobacter sp. Cpo091]UJB77228.1 restriction endonuclease subunit S [Citrobacter portucalensis]